MNRFLSIVVLFLSIISGVLCDSAQNLSSNADATPAPDNPSQLKDEYILLDARGTLIKTVASSSGILRSSPINNWWNENKYQAGDHSYFLDINASLVHQILDVLRYPLDCREYFNSPVFTAFYRGLQFDENLRRSIIENALQQFQWRHPGPAIQLPRNMCIGNTDTPICLNAINQRLKELNLLQLESTEYENLLDRAAAYLARISGGPFRRAPQGIAPTKFP